MHVLLCVPMFSTHEFTFFVAYFFFPSFFVPIDRKVLVAWLACFAVLMFVQRASILALVLIAPTAEHTHGNIHHQIMEYFVFRC